MHELGKFSSARPRSEKILGQVVRPIWNLPISYISRGFDGITDETKRLKFKEIVTGMASINTIVCLHFYGTSQEEYADEHLDFRTTGGSVLR